MTQRSSGHGDRPTAESYSTAAKLLLVAIVAFGSVLALGGVAATHGTGPNSLIDYDEGENPRINESTLTVAEHNQSEFDSLLHYYDDNGDVAEIEHAHINESIKNPVGVRYDNLDDENLREFPRKDDEIDMDDDGTENSASAIDASEWTNQSSNNLGSGSLAIEDVTNNSVEGVRIEGSSVSSNTGALAEYSNVSITSDANKRVMTLFLTVEELGSNAQVNITAEESDGDYKRAYIDSSKSSGSTDVAATATGDGVVYQAALSDLTTEGSGDGSFDAIDKVTVNVTDGDAELTFTSIDVGRKSTLDLGTIRSDTDGDGDKEDKEITQNADGGYERLTGLGTMDDTLSDATIYDLEVHQVFYSMEDLPAGDGSPDDPQNMTHVAWKNATTYASYNHRLEQYARLKVPTAIDLSHSGLTLESEQELVADRYQTVEYGEDTGDTTFENVSYSSATDSWDSQGDHRSFDTSVSAGQNYTIHYSITLLDSEKDDIQSVASSGGGGGGPVDDGSGGVGAALAWLGAAAGTIWVTFAKVIPGLKARSGG